MKIHVDFQVCSIHLIDSLFLFSICYPCSVSFLFLFFSFFLFFFSSFDFFFILPTAILFHPSIHSGLSICFHLDVQKKPKRIHTCFPVYWKEYFWIIKGGIVHNGLRARNARCNRCHQPGGDAVCLPLPFRTGVQAPSFTNWRICEFDSHKQRSWKHLL